MSGTYPAFDILYGKGILIQVGRHDPLYNRLKWIPTSYEFKPKESDELYGSGESSGVVIPFSLTLWRQAVRISRNSLDPSESLISLLMRAIETEDRIINQAKDIGRSLRPDAQFQYQAVGSNFLYNNKGAILADDMGLGKTRTAINAVHRSHVNWLNQDSYGSYTVLVVAPNTVLYSWKDEIHKVLSSGTEVFVATGTKLKKTKTIEEFSASTRSLKFLIISYETARTLSGFKAVSNKKGKPNGILNTITYHTMIVDEAHKIANRNSQQTRAVWRLSEGTENRYALTGTPVVNNHGDLWSLLRFIEPHTFTSYHKFVNYYLKTWEPPWGGIQIEGIKPDVESEYRRMVDSRMRRVVKSQVMRQLPGKTHQTIRVDMNPAQAKAYRQMAKEFMTEIDGKPVEAFYQIAQWGHLFNIAQGVEPHPHPKVDVLHELLSQRGDKSTVVFSDRLGVLRRAYESDPLSAELIVGGTSSEEVESIAKAFQNGEIRTLYCSLRAANAGITLTKADTMIFLNRSWSQVQNQQAEDRIHRIGQTQNCHYISLVTNNTVEAGQINVLLNKGATLEEVVRDKQRLARFIHGEQ